MTERKPMTKRMVIMLICVGLLLAALVGFNQFRTHMFAKFMAGNAAPPATVSAVVASFQSWQPQLAAVGSLRAVRGVDVTTEVAGLVREIAFRSGQEVKANQILVRLNDDADVALLHSLEAAAELAQTVYRRDQAQYDIKAIAKAQLDADAADLKGKQAQVAGQAALVEKKTIRAPFAGRLGITTINPGQYINPGDAIVTLQAIDPIYADFYLPQQQLALMIVHAGFDLHVARGAVDFRADRLDLAHERLPAIRVGVDHDALVDRELAELLLRKGEVRVDRIDGLQRDDRIARVEVLPRVDRGDPHAPRKRCADGFLFDQRGLSRDLCVLALQVGGVRVELRLGNRLDVVLRLIAPVDGLREFCCRF